MNKIKKLQEILIDYRLEGKLSHDLLVKEVMAYINHYGDNLSIEFLLIHLQRISDSALELKKRIKEQV
jgi:hypothetical protein